jgi:magnesium-transporting ATPase (P-type)
MNKIIFKYLIINFFTTIIITTMFVLLGTYMYENYFKEQDASGHKIIISNLELYGFIAIAVSVFSCITLFPVFLNLIEKIRTNTLFCFLSFFLILTIAWLYVFCTNNFEIQSIIIAICMVLNHAIFYFRFKRFLHAKQ